MKIKLIAVAMVASLCFAVNASADYDRGRWRDDDDKWRHESYQHRQERWRTECRHYCENTVWHRWCFKRCMRDKREHYSHWLEEHRDGRW